MHFCEQDRQRIDQKLITYEDVFEFFAKKASENLALRFLELYLN